MFFDFFFHVNVKKKNQVCNVDNSKSNPNLEKPNIGFYVRYRNIIRFVYRMVTIFLLALKTTQGGPFRYLQHGHDVNRKFFRDTSKKVLSPKILPSVATLTQFGAI